MKKGTAGAVPWYTMDNYACRVSGWCALRR